MPKISIVTLHRVTGQETLKVLLPSLRLVNTFVNEVRRNLQFDILRASLITPPPYGHPLYKQRGSLQGRAKGSRRSLTYCTKQILTRIVGLHRDDLALQPGRATRARALDGGTAREEKTQSKLCFSLVYPYLYDCIV